MDKRTKIIGIILSCFFITFFSSARSEEIVVKMSELPNAITKAKPGDIFLVEEGKLTDVNLTLQANFDYPVVIKPKVAGGVVFSGGSTVLVKGSRNLVFSGFLFDRVKSKNIFILSNSHNVSVSDNYFFQCGESRFGVILGIKDGSSKNEIFNNTFDGNRSMGVVVFATPTNLTNKQNQENRIYCNFFYNIPSVKSIYPDTDGNGLEAVQVGQGNESSHEWELNTYIYNNLFEKIVGDGSEIISNKTSRNYIYNNTFLDNKSGITLRLGDNVTVNNNYLENTTKGIRVFGYGHKISNNYVKNADIGIQLPSTNLRRGVPRSSTAYYQQVGCDISDNYIVSSDGGEAITVGAGTLDLLPESTKIRRNSVVVGSRNTNELINAKSSRQLTRQNIRLSGNEIMVFSEDNLQSANPSAGDEGRSSRSRSANYSSRQVRVRDVGRERILSPLSVLGFTPFSSKDPAVGATWKRPN